MKFQDVVDQAVNLAALKACPEQCHCAKTEVRERTIRGGSKQFIRQCLDCGESVGNAVKHAGSARVFDESLRDAVREMQKAARDAARQEESNFWWGEYKRYMSSPEWKFLRVQILARDKQVCQGCLLATATDVHHRTYEHFGKEFAFELISLCKPCHERMHDTADH